MDQETPTSITLSEPEPRLTLTNKRALWTVAGIFLIGAVAVVSGIFVSGRLPKEGIRKSASTVEADTGTPEKAPGGMDERHEKTAGNKTQPLPASAPNPDAAKTNPPPNDGTHGPMTGYPPTAYEQPPLSPYEQGRADSYSQYTQDMTAPMPRVTALEYKTAPQDQQQPVLKNETQDASALLPELSKLLKGQQANQEPAKQQETDPGEPAPFRRQPRNGRYLLPAGTFIHYSFDAKVVSDLPGQVGAVIDENVKDDQGETLIPQGSRLVGDYNARVKYGDDRILQVWTRLIFPDKSSLTLADLKSYHLDGSAGSKGDANNHWGPFLRDAAIVTAFAAAIALTQRQSSTLLAVPSYSATVGQQVGAQLGQLGSEVLRRNLSITPTIELKAGAGGFTRLWRDIVLDGPYEPWPL